MIRFALVVTLAACGPGAPGGPSMNNKLGGGDLSPTTSKVVSKDILAREPLTNIAQVKHILISWKEQAEASGRGDPRAMKRTKADAENEISNVVAQVKAGTNFEELMKKYSEDGGSAKVGQAYKVTPDATLVIEFKLLGLRLHIDEIGVCESEFGFHIMKRVE